MITEITRTIVSSVPFPAWATPSMVSHDQIGNQLAIRRGLWL